MSSGRLLAACALLITACSLITCTDLKLIPPSGIVVDVPGDSVSFAVIGDYGDAGPNEAAVAALVSGADVAFILTVGDNNYPSGDEKTLQANIGDYYGDWIYNPDAPGDLRCQGLASAERQNRFFPSPGNHDAAGRDGLLPYLNYFTLPGEELFYGFRWGPVRFFSLSSNGSLSHQEAWLEEQLAGLTDEFVVVYFHHSPYSSGVHGNEPNMQWAFEGVDLVLSGHDHIYERITPIPATGTTYLVNGLGGRKKRVCQEEPLPGEDFESHCYDGNYGALFVEANATRMSVRFTAVDGMLIDSFSILR